MRFITTALLAAAFVLVLCIASIAQAQRMPMAAPPTGGLGNLPGISFNQPHVRFGLGRHSALPRFPDSGGVPVFFGDEQPTTVIVENVLPQPKEETKVELPAVQERVPEPPLILEKDGDTWIRRTPDQYGPRANERTSNRVEVLAPTQLVFRDGKRLELTRYIIVGTTLYENTEHWTRRIQIADLDLPSTIRLNRQRGVEFRIPRDANEVVTRP